MNQVLSNGELFISNSLLLKNSISYFKPVRTFLIFTVTACFFFILSSFFLLKAFTCILQDADGFSLNVPLITQCSIHKMDSDRLHADKMQCITCCNEGLSHQIHEPSFLSLVPK